MKKRLLPIILSIVAMTMLVLPVCAEDTTVNTLGGSGNTNLTYTVASTFTVTIPENVTINSVDGTSTSTISAAGVMIANGEVLEVAVTGSSNYSSGFRLNDSYSNYIPYTIKVNEGVEGIVSGAKVLSVEAGTLTGSAILKFKTTGNATKSGTYTDQLTFTVTKSSVTP